MWLNLPRPFQQLFDERDAYKRALERIADPLNHHQKPSYAWPEQIAREALKQFAKKGDEDD